MSIKVSQRVLNFKPQKKDNRDYIFKINENIPLKTSINLTNTTVNNIVLKKCPILDQGTIGSCLAHAIYVMMYILSNGKITSSRLYNYLCYRQIDNESLSEDTGGSVRAGMSSIKYYGLCNEGIWPYVNIQNNFKKLPPLNAFVLKYNIKNFVYTFVSQNELSIKNSLTQTKPIVLGIAIYDSFDNSINGIIPLPDIKNESLLGYHAIVLIGYDDIKKLFKFQNSWGVSWGDKGYGYLPYDYVTNNNLAFDLCTASFTI